MSRNLAPSTRQHRACEVLRDSIAKLFMHNPFHDPDLLGQRLTIDHVTISPDLKNAKIYLVSATLQNPENILSALNRNTGFVRKHLARDIVMRSVPRISFALDHSNQHQQRIDAILAQIRQ
ncbi:MAG: 30S ribosome-binding factor RbfA [Pseudomonadota bacterium]